MIGGRTCRDNSWKIRVSKNSCFRWKWPFLFWYNCFNVERTDKFCFFTPKINKTAINVEFPTPFQFMLLHKLMFHHSTCSDWFCCEEWSWNHFIHDFAMNECRPSNSQTAFVTGFHRGKQSAIALPPPATAKTIFAQNVHWGDSTKKSPNYFQFLLQSEKPRLRCHIRWVKTKEGRGKSIWKFCVFAFFSRTAGMGILIPLHQTETISLEKTNNWVKTDRHHHHHHRELILPFLQGEKDHGFEPYPPTMTDQKLPRVSNMVSRKSFNNFAGLHFHECVRFLPVRADQNNAPWWIQVDPGKTFHLELSFSVSVLTRMFIFAPSIEILVYKFGGFFCRITTRTSGTKRTKTKTWRTT